MLNLLDFILLIIFFGFLFSGFVYGFIRSLGSLIGTLAAIYFASHWYEPVASYLEPLFGGYANLSRVLCFLLVFILIDIAVTVVFYIINKIVNLFTFIPLLKTVNRLGGALIGFLKGLFVTGIIVYVLTKYPLWDFLSNALAGSKIVPLLVRLSNLVSPLLPLALKQIESIL